MIPVHRRAIARPRLVLWLAGAALAAAALGLPRLELDTDGRALVPRRAPAVAADRAIRELFDVRDPIAVVLRTERRGGVFHRAVLRRVRDLTDAVLALEGGRAEDVLSLATERGFRVAPGTLRFRTLLDPLPETRAEIRQLRDDLRRIELYDGILVSRDGQSAAILIGTPPDADRAALVGEIRRLAASAPAAGSDVAIEVIGAPAAEALLGRHILADLALLVPVALAVMALVFLVAFRRPAAALLPLAEAGGCLVIVFGLMGWLGVPVYLSTAVLPVILTAVGLADEIHIFRRYVDLVRERPDRDVPDGERPQLVRAALDEMAPPVVRTSLTTAVAFLSFALSPIGPVRVFGLFTAFGVLVCLAWSLTVVPAVLALVPADRWVAPARSDGRASGAFARLAALVRRRRAAVLAAALVFALAAVDGARRIEVQDSWLAGFDPASAFARATRHFDRQFLGSHRLLLAVEGEPRLAGQPPPLMDPEVLERIGGLETFVGSLPGVGGVLGPARFLETVGFMLRPDAPAARRLPNHPEKARRRWDHYRRIRGEERLGQLVDPEFTRGLISVYLAGSDYASARRLEAQIRDHEDRWLAPHGLRLAIGGDVAVSRALIDAVVATQLRSLFLSLVGIFAVAALLGRSLRWGFFCVVPPAAAVLSIFAAMGWLGIPLGVATSMFAGMTLGVGVDFAIHLMSRHRRLLDAGDSGREAMAGAFRVTGPAIVIDALAVGLGFGVLVFSQVPANARLGGLLVLSVVGCLAATLLLVPALAASSRAEPSSAPSSR